MATRTAKGSAKAKASGTTLTLSSVSLTMNHAIFAIVGFQGTAVPTSVKAGTKDLNKVIQRIDLTAGFGGAIYYKRVIRNGGTRDIVATWASAIGARAMAVITVDEPMLFLEGAGNMENTASPTTSQAASDLPVHDCFHLGGFISQGPSNDAVPTLSTDWTAGQRDGTVGVPPVSNITVMEGYKFGRCIDAEEMDSSGSVTRDFCNILASFEPLSDVPSVSYNNEEIKVGDTVRVVGEISTTTVSSLVRVLGYPFVKCVLADGRTYSHYHLEVIE